METIDYGKMTLMQPFMLNDGELYSVSALEIDSQPIHIHDGLELIYLLKGTAEVKISFNLYRLTAGDFLLIDEGEVHRLVSREEPCQVLVLEAAKQAFKEDLFAFDIEFYRHHNSENIQQIVENMVKLYEKRGEADALFHQITKICDKHFLMQFFDVNHQIAKEPFDRPVNRMRIGNFYKFVYDGFQTRIRLDNVAKQESIESTYAAKIIKSETGDTFQTHINIVRVDRSEVLLLGSDMTVQQITDFLGFASYDYYNRIFKERFGMTPGAYRKQYRKETWPYSAYKQRALDRRGPLRELPWVAEERKSGDYDQLMREIEQLLHHYNLSGNPVFEETDEELRIILKK